jgi:hypothetical protein
MAFPQTNFKNTSLQRGEDSQPIRRVVFRSSQWRDISVLRRKYRAPALWLYASGTLPGGSPSDPRIPSCYPASVL